METRIAFATDLHFISPRLTDYGEAFRKVVLHADGKMMMRIEETLDAFVSDVLSLHPDALILGGDMTFNGSAASHEDFAAALTPLREAGIPVLCIPGNHDLGQYPAARFQGTKAYVAESMTSKRYAALFSPFGYADAVSKTPDSFSCVYAVRPDLYLLMLDVNSAWRDFAKGDRRLTSAGEVSDATLHWMEEALSMAQREGATVIAVSHQSLLPHNPMFIEGFRMRRYEKVLALYHKYGVKVNLCGHMHIQHICREDSEDATALTEIATSALSVAPLQYGVITVTDDAGASSNASVAEGSLPAGKVAGLHLTYESRLLPVSFREDAISYFKENAGEQILRTLPEGAAFSEKERVLMRGAFAVCNAAYFAGDSFPAACYEHGTDLYEGLRLLLSMDKTFHGIYVRSILADRKAQADHHRWEAACVP